MNRRIVIVREEGEKGEGYAKEFKSRLETDLKDEDQVQIETVLRYEDAEPIEPGCKVWFLSGKLSRQALGLKNARKEQVEVCVFSSVFNPEVTHEGVVFLDKNDAALPGFLGALATTD